MDTNHKDIKLLDGGLLVFDPDTLPYNGVRKQPELKFGAKVKFCRYVKFGSPLLDLTVDADVVPRYCVLHQSPTELQGVVTGIVARSTGEIRKITPGEYDSHREFIRKAMMYVYRVKVELPKDEGFSQYEVLPFDAVELNNG